MLGSIGLLAASVRQRRGLGAGLQAARACAGVICRLRLVLDGLLAYAATCHDLPAAPFLVRAGGGGDRNGTIYATAPRDEKT